MRLGLRLRNRRGRIVREGTAVGAGSVTGTGSARSAGRVAPPTPAARNLSATIDRAGWRELLTGLLGFVLGNRIRR